MNNLRFCLHSDKATAVRAAGGFVSSPQNPRGNLKKNAPLNAEADTYYLL